MSNYSFIQDANFYFEIKESCICLGIRCNKVIQLFDLDHHIEYLSLLEKISLYITIKEIYHFRLNKYKKSR